MSAHFRPPDPGVTKFCGVCGGAWPDGHRPDCPILTGEPQLAQNQMASQLMNRFNKPSDDSLDELKRFSDEQLRKYGVSHWILDESGNVIDASFIEWVLWFEKNHQRVIQQDYPGQYKVSTVFIGLENELFETMVFGPKEETEWFDGTKRLMRPSLWTERCATLSEAKEMHQRGLDWLKANADVQSDDQSR